MKKRILKYIDSHSPDVQAIIWIISSCFWFSVMATIIRHMSTGMSSTEMVFFRNLFATIFILPWGFQIGFSNIKTERLSLYLLRTISGLVGMTMIFHAITIVPMTEAVALTYVLPLITAVFAIIFLGEKITLQKWAGLLIGFAGVLVILRPGTATFQYGSLFVIATACCWSVSNILVKKLTRTEHPKKIILLMMLIITPLSFPLALLNWTTPTLEQILWLALLGWVSNHAQFSMTHAFSKAEMHVVLPFDFSRLIFITAFAYIFFGEVIDLWTLAGAVIILSSSIYIASKEHKQRKLMEIEPRM